jgi:hypothetical protein
LILLTNTHTRSHIIWKANMKTLDFVFLRNSLPHWAHCPNCHLYVNQMQAHGNIPAMVELFYLFSQWKWEKRNRLSICNWLKISMRPISASDFLFSSLFQFLLLLLHQEIKINLWQQNMIDSNWIMHIRFIHILICVQCIKMVGWKPTTAA